jgi:hypothetical protein
VLGPEGFHLLVYRLETGTGPAAFQSGKYRISKTFAHHQKPCDLCPEPIVFFCRRVTQ